MKEYVEIRCFGDRPHMVKGLVKQDCGALLVGVPVDEDSDLVVRCKVCKTMWHVSNEDGDITMDEVNEMNLTR